MDEMLLQVENRHIKYVRPTTDEKKFKFYSQPIPNVFSHFNPSFARVEKSQLESYSVTSNNL